MLTELLLYQFMMFICLIRIVFVHVYILRSFCKSYALLFFTMYPAQVWLDMNQNVDNLMLRTFQNIHQSGRKYSYFLKIFEERNRYRLWIIILKSNLLTWACHTFSDAFFFRAPEKLWHISCLEMELI